MARPSPGQKTALATGGILLSLLLLEAGLRIGGFVWSWNRNQAEPDIAFEDGGIRILCIGESTAAFGYPATVRRLLRGDPSHAFRVWNRGRAGATSPELIAALPAHLDRFRPQIVVAMMGINDVEIGPAGPRPTRLLESLRVYGLYALLWEHLTMSGRRRVDPLKTIAVAVPELDEFEAARRAGQIERATDLLLSMDASTLSWPQRVQFGIRARNWTSRLLSLGDETEAADAVVRKGLEVIPPEVAGLRSRLELLLARVHHQQGRRDLAEAILIGARDSAHLRPVDLPVTRESHRRLKEILEQRGIHLVAVQYPMRDVDTLRSLYDDPTGITFVDNGPTFQRAVERLGYFEIFVDHFAGDFGHMTRRGKGLLGRNVARAITEGIARGEIPVPTPGGTPRSRRLRSGRGASDRSAPRRRRFPSRDDARPRSDASASRRLSADVEGGHGR